MLLIRHTTLLHDDFDLHWSNAGKLRDIEALRLELKDECSETHEARMALCYDACAVLSLTRQQGLVAIQAIWDEKNPM